MSRVRLESYRPPGGSDLDMITTYFYNLELSESLYPCLQAFEVALRNSIDLTLARHFTSATWFDTPGFLLSWQQNEIANARKSLTSSGKPHDSGRIIAELKLGFWHSLFNAPFEQALWRPNRSALITDVFPQITRTNRSRKAVHARIDLIRKLRNRVMHFEPIWHRPDLAGDHALVLETIHWISSDMYEAIALCDRFDPVFAGGRRSVEQRILSEVRDRYPLPPYPDS